MAASDSDGSNAMLYLRPLLQERVNLLPVATQKGEKMNNSNGGNKSFRNNTTMLVTLALLVALNIVLARFLSFNAWNLRIGFAFVSTFVGAYLYGPVGGAVVAGLGDVLGATLFPTGAFFPGFTVTAVVSGIIYGVFLNKKQALPNVVIAVLLNQIICSLLLNSLWISILYGSPYKALLVTRSFQCVILTVVEIVTITILSQAFNRANIKRIAGIRTK